jgi:hypothetical protein
MASSPVFLALNIIQIVNGSYFNLAIYFLHILFTIIGFVAIIFQQSAKNHERERDFILY